jgi:MFS superfamily sulfate permease-like transporter
VIILSVYAIDTITPLGEPVWLLYFIPLVLSYWSSRYYAIPTVFLVTVLFLVGGFLLSPEGIPVQMAILNRFTFFLFFFIVSLLLWTIRGRQIREENL